MGSFAFCQLRPLRPLPRALGSFAFWGAQQEYCVTVVKGGFTTYKVSSTGEMSAGVDTRLEDGELDVDCVALLER